MKKKISYQVHNLFSCFFYFFKIYLIVKIHNILRRLIIENSKNTGINEDNVRKLIEMENPMTNHNMISCN